MTDGPAEGGSALPEKESRAASAASKDLARAVIEQAQAAIKHDDAVRAVEPDDRIWQLARAHRNAEEAAKVALERAVSTQVALARAIARESR